MTFLSFSTFGHCIFVPSSNLMFFMLLSFLFYILFSPVESEKQSVTLFDSSWSPKTRLDVGWSHLPITAGASKLRHLGPNLKPAVKKTKCQGNLIFDSSSSPAPPLSVCVCVRKRVTETSHFSVLSFSFLPLSCKANLLITGLERAEDWKARWLSFLPLSLRASLCGEE